MRVIALLLAFLLGFLSCVGAIVGTAYYAYSNVSYDKLEEWNFIPSGMIDDYVDRDADRPFSSLTLANIVGDVRSFTGEDGRTTLERLVDRYGLVIPEDARKFIPDSVMELAVSDLFTGAGLDYILDHTTLDYIFDLDLIPEDILSEAAESELRGKTLRMIAELDLAGLLSGVKLGYLAGAEYHYDEELGYVLDYADPENPTLVELFAPLDLGSLIDALLSSEDLLGVVRDQIGTATLYHFANALGFGDIAIVRGTLDDSRTVATLLHPEEDGTYSIDIYGLFNNRYIGELLGYTPVYPGGDETAPVIGWRENGMTVTGLMLGLARGYLTDLGTDAFDSNSLIDEVYFGDLLGMVPEYDEEGNIAAWITLDGSEPDPMYGKLAPHKLTEAIGDEGDFKSILQGMYVGDMLGYHQNGEGKWLDADENPVTGVNAVVAEIDIGRLVDADDDYDLHGVIAAHQIGELLNWQKTDGVWTDSRGAAVTGLMVSFADLTVDEMSDSARVTEVINDLKIADVMSYTERDGDYYTSSGSKVTGIMAILAAKTIGQLDDDEEGGLNTIRIGDIMGWSYDETNDVWLREDGTTATGLMTSFAPLSVADMSNDEKVNDAIDTIVIGEAMGYYLNPDDGYWYRDRAYTDRLTGIIASLADTKIGGLGTKIENLTLGDAFDASAFNSGFLSLLDPDTRITEMDTAATDAYQAANIEKLIDAGLLSFTPAQETSLDYIFGSNAWKAFTIQEFLNQLILRAASAAP